MAWIDTKQLLHKGRKAHRGQKGLVDYEAIYEVVFSDMRDGPGMAESAPNVCPYYQDYNFGNEVDHVALCTDKVANQVGPCVYEVTCKWETVASNAFNTQNPLDAIPIIEWDSGRSEMLLEFDRETGEALQNFVFDPYTEVPTI